MNDQRSTLDQLNDLHKLAVEHGMYDAADWLKARMADVDYWQAERYPEDIRGDVGGPGDLTGQERVDMESAAAEIAYVESERAKNGW